MRSARAFPPIGRSACACREPIGPRAAGISSRPIGFAKAVSAWLRCHPCVERRLDAGAADPGGAELSGAARARRQGCDELADRRGRSDHRATIRPKRLSAPATPIWSPGANHYSMTRAGRGMPRHILARGEGAESVSALASPAAIAICSKPDDSDRSKCLLKGVPDFRKRASDRRLHLADQTENEGLGQRPKLHSSATIR